MPTIQCPIEGFENVTISYPDEWLMKHIDQWHYGRSQAPENASPLTQETFGAIALCDKIEGIDLANITELPLRYVGLFRWLRDVVYGSYLNAFTVEKKA